jgi:hypothetical protein
MLRASLVYVGKDANVPQTLVLKTQPGNKLRLTRIKETLDSGLTQQVAPVLLTEDDQHISTEFDKGEPTHITSAMQNMISRNHCYISCGPWTVTDNSSNGTWFSSVDDTDHKYERLEKNEPKPLRHGDRLCFGPPASSIWQYEFRCSHASSATATSSDGSSATATSSDGSAPPSVMQKLLDSLVEIETLKQENRKLNDVASDLRKDLDRSQKETQEEMRQRIGLKLKLADVEKQLEAECLVKQGAVEALTACKEDLKKANQELTEERAISDKLQRFKNMFDPEVQKGMNREDGALDFDVEDHQSMVQTLAAVGASSKAAETQAVSPSLATGPSSKKSVAWDSPQFDAPCNDWMPCPDTNPEWSKNGRWVRSGNKRKIESEKQESKEGSEKQVSKEGSAPESQEGSRRRNPRRT